MAHEENIFLTSTYEDLFNYRESVKNTLVSCGKLFVGMEDFGSTNSNSLNTSLEKLQGCDRVICLIGTRYGTCPTGYDKSYMELEIDFAIKQNKIINIYCLDDDNYPVLKRFIETGEAADKLCNFKKRLQEKYNIAKYTTPENLANKISTDLLKDAEKLLKEKTYQYVARTYRETSYDYIAQWYDYWYEGHWDSDEPYKTICSIAKTYFESERGNIKNRKILDCACGTGNTFYAFTLNNYDIFGVDGSKEMLIRANLNIKSKGVSPEKLIMEPINWNHMDGYLKYFNESYFDIILITANSFCHIPPTEEYMINALKNFYKLLTPGGILIIDTKKYIKTGTEAKPIYKELRYYENDWIERYERIETRKLNGLGEVNFHTRVVYDTDPSFNNESQRVLIIITVYGKNISPSTYVIPYYPLPAKILANKMNSIGFNATIYPALDGLASEWKYDIVVAHKPKYSY